MKISNTHSRTSFFWLAGLLSNASGWLFALIANQSLSLADMGNLSLLTNSITLVSIGSLSIAIATNTFGSENTTEAKNTATAFGRLALWSGMVISALFIVASPWWTKHFNFPDSFLIVGLSSFILFLMFPLAWIRGWYQARLSLVFVGSGLLIEAFSKVILATFSLNQSNAFAIIIASMAGASCIAVIFYGLSESLSLLRMLFSPSSLQRQHWIFLVKVMIARIGVISLITIDIFFAKKYLPADQAGIYALLSLVGKAIFFVMQSFYVLITPLIAPSLQDSTQRRWLMAQVLAGAVGLIALLIGLYVFLPEYSIGILLGERYTLIMPYVLLYSIANGVLSIALLVSLYKMLRGQFIFTMLVMVALGTEIFLMQIFNQSIGHIARNVLLASVVMAGSALVTYIATFAKSNRA